ncbi:MAG: sugar ABC transporter permease [Chloroflexota bacterium]|nr:sugar ABC transporter permease [Chloroflexota bacterium]MDQ5867600.1 sugar ABC transporter permease [Chloroflexota bacterium]
MRAADLLSARGAPRRRQVPMGRARTRWGWFFLSPWLIGFVAFQALPIVATIFLSFTDYSATKEFAPGNFNMVGLDNYGRLFNDPQLLQSLGVTVKFALIAVPIGLVIPLSFALLVNSRHLMAPNVFRTLYFLPTVIPIVAGVMVFQGVLNAQSGWINLMLEAIGIDGPRWLSDPNWAVPALNLLGLWGVGNAMLILLASLQGVPTELYDAATIDGANGAQRFFYITLPMISPVIFYNVTLGIIGAFQYFVAAMLIGGRNGDPQGATLFYNLHFYRQAFVFNDMGYASVLALLLFVIVMILTTLMFYFGQRSVYYAGGDL